MDIGVSADISIMSFVNLSAMLVSIFLIRTRPTAPEARAARGPLFNRAVFRLSEFWSIALSLLVAIIGYSTPYTFLASWVAERFPQLTGMAATGPVSVLAFSVCIGRALVGFCADYVGPLNTYIAVFFLSGVIQLALWLTAHNLAGTYAFAVLYGLIAPGFLGLLPQIVVTVLGPTALASNLGILLMFNAPGNLIGGPMGGGIRDATGSYDWTIASGGILQLVGGVIALWGEYVHPASANVSPLPHVAEAPQPDLVIVISFDMHAGCSAEFSLEFETGAPVSARHQCADRLTHRTVLSTATVTMTAREAETVSDGN